MDFDLLCTTTCCRETSKQIAVLSIENIAVEIKFLPNKFDYETSFQKFMIKFPKYHMIPIEKEKAEKSQVGFIQIVLILTRKVVVSPRTIIQQATQACNGPIENQHLKHRFWMHCTYIFQREFFL